MADGQDDPRFELLSRWVREELQMRDARIEPASADASFRRYFRVLENGRSHIVMDAPPGKEDLGPFLHAAQLLLAAQMNVPRVVAQSLERGLLLLSDLGSQLYLPALGNASAVDGLYQDALTTLLRMQRGVPIASAALPSYDAARLEAEMQLMPEWFLQRHLGKTPDAASRRVLTDVFRALNDGAAAQPQVFVHRDFHSRNLLVCQPGAPGVLDFQDAVIGPITYDLVSLLKDCYISWPASRVQKWALEFRRALSRDDTPSDEQFLTWFDWMGVQRHLKVLGIFARLWYRDGKPGYLKDLPLVLSYVLEAAARHAQLAPLARLLEDLEPAFRHAQAREDA